MNEETYKIIWIDDDTSIVDDYQRRAEKHNLDLIHFTNWEEAYAELKRNFDEYSAIILDALCKRDPDDIAHEDFLIEAITQLNSLMGTKQRDIPWYILSAFRDKFKSKFESMERLRKNNTEEWGLMEYSKIASTGAENHMDILFENILRVAKQKGLNKALNRHAMMLNYLGEGKLIRHEARKLMLRMLSALYCPEENVDFQFEANPLRKVLEYIFRAAKDKGLVPNECFENGIHLNDASRYMSGLNLKNSDVRYGKPGNDKYGRGGDAIFTPDIAQIVWNLLTYTNGGSHTEEEPIEEPYIVNEEGKELFFGYVFQLCHFIKWFGKYVDKHPSVEENRKMKRLVPIGSDISADRQTNSKNQKKEKKESFSLRVSREDVFGKEYSVLSGETGKYVGSCKLSPELNAQTNVRDKVRIVDIVNNDGSDKARYPFIVTKIEKL